MPRPDDDRDGFFGLGFAIVGAVILIGVVMMVIACCTGAAR